MGFLALKPSVGLCRSPRTRKPHRGRTLRASKKFTTGLYGLCVLRLVAKSSLASVPALDGKPYQHEAFNVVWRSRGFHPNQSIAVEYASHSAHSGFHMRAIEWPCSPRWQAMSTAAAVPCEQSRGLHLRRLRPLASARFLPCQAAKDSGVGRLGAGWIKRQS